MAIFDPLSGAKQSQVRGHGLRRQRIVHFVTSAKSAQLLMRGQSRFLRAIGFDLHVLCDETSQLTELEGCRVHGVPIEREISGRKDLRSLWHASKILKRLKPALVNASTPKAGLIGSIAAFIVGTPVRVYTLRGLRLETVSGMKRRLLWGTEWLSSRLATRVLCVSHSLQDAYVELGCAPRKKTVVLGLGSSNGVDLERYSEIYHNRHELRQIHSAKLGIPEGARIVGFVGRLTRDKGIRELAEVYRRVSQEHAEVYLVLVGDFEPGDPVDEETSAWLLSHPRVRITGFVADSAPYYALFDALIFPSYREGFPNVPLEAAAAGVPVVGFAATGTVDAVLDGVTGVLVPIGDTHRLAGACLALLHDEHAARDFSMAAQRHAAHYDQEVVWSALAAFYEDELAAASPQAGLPSCVKRSIDLAVACLLLGLSAPLVAAVSAALLLSQGRPIFYRQERPGLHGKPFRIFKFRTMTDERSASGKLLADHERLTVVGRVVRSLSLDELPQLLNVLLGQMSLVGPRPLLMHYLPLYSAEQARRHLVLPGITGWAQVNGRNEIDWDRRLRLDVEYVDDWSLWLDLRILLSTLRVVSKRSGISQAGHATMPEFTGDGNAARAGVRVT